MMRLLFIFLLISEAWSFIQPAFGPRLTARRLLSAMGRPSPASSSHSSNTHRHPSHLTQLASSVRAEVVGGPYSRVEWRRMGEVDIAFPPDFAKPKGIIHFVGGAVVGAFPKTSYGPLIERLAMEGYVAVATPLPFSIFDHEVGAAGIAGLYRGAENLLKNVYGSQFLEEVPTFGLGHSLGSKIHVLLGARGMLPRRRANILVSFNNFSAKESVPLLDELKKLGEAVGMVKGLDLSSKLDDLSLFIDNLDLSQLSGGLDFKRRTGSGFDMVKQGLGMALNFLNGAVASIPGEFRPSPDETWQILENDYRVPRNLVIQFDQDSIDQSPQLSYLLNRRFPGQGRVQSSKLPGSHITPNTPEAVIDLGQQPEQSVRYTTAETAAAAAAAGGGGGGGGSSIVTWDGIPQKEVGQAWFDEKGVDVEHVSRAAAQKAKRELEALASAIVSYLNEAPTWPQDPLGELGVGR